MVLMDSHLYDYRPMLAEQRAGEITRWADEIRAVHGEACMAWHQRTLHPDYGWGEGYEHLLKLAGTMRGTLTR